MIKSAKEQILWWASPTTGSVWWPSAGGTGNPPTLPILHGQRRDISYQGPVCRGNQGGTESNRAPPGTICGPYLLDRVNYSSSTGRSGRLHHSDLGKMAECSIPAIHQDAQGEAGSGAKSASAPGWHLSKPERTSKSATLPLDTVLHHAHQYSITLVLYKQLPLPVRGAIRGGTVHSI